MKNAFGHVARVVCIAYVIGLSAATSAFGTIILDANRDLTFYEQSGFQNYSDGTDPKLYIQRVGAGLDQRALVHFDALPGGLTGAQVVSAVVRVELARSLGDTIAIRRMTQDWTAGPSDFGTGASWLNYDGTNAWSNGSGAIGDSASPTDTQLLPNLGLTTSGTFIDFDVTNTVKGWADATFSDFGVLFVVTVDAGNATNTQFFATESNVGAGPQLIIETTSIPEPASIGLLGMGAGVLISGRRRRA